MYSKKLMNTANSLGRRDLPEELYRALWTRLDLKSAVFGRSKVLYSSLRELVMERERS
mgnify:CR=1 FL=1